MNLNELYQDASELFSEYRSPDNEASAYKMIPIEFREHKIVKLLERTGARVMYRGPRPRMRSRYPWERYLGKCNCLKKNATHFSIYLPRDV